MDLQLMLTLWASPCLNMGSCKIFGTIFHVSYFLSWICQFRIAGGKLTADGRVGRERGKQGLQEAASTLKIFSIQIEVPMQQSNANGKSALSGPHDHGIWNGLRHESVNFEYLSRKNGWVDGFRGAHGDGSK